MPAKGTVPVRLTVEAVREARVAAATKEMSLVEYASAKLLAAALEDNDQWSKGRAQRGAPGVVSSVRTKKSKRGE